MGFNVELDLLWSWNEICFKFYNEIYQQNEMNESDEKNVFFFVFFNFEEMGSIRDNE